MSDKLFVEFEERPPGCSACLVNHDNIDAVARYYHTGMESSVVTRDENGVTLTISYKGETTTVRPGQVLIHGHPPTVADHDDFNRKWRLVP